MTMLVLSRHASESVRVGDDRRLTVRAIHGDFVKIAFVAQLIGGRTEGVTEVVTLRRYDSRPFGPDVEVTIVDIRPGKVRLGITAPATMVVNRI